MGRKEEMTGGTRKRALGQRVAPDSTDWFHTQLWPGVVKGAPGSCPVSVEFIWISGTPSSPGWEWPLLVTDTLPPRGNK